MLRTIEADLRSNVDPTRRTGIGFWVWVIGKALAAPQVHVVILFRLAHAVAQTPLRPFAFVIRSIGLAWSGAEIHPDAQLAPGLALAHSTGVMIGAHVRTGVDFRIYPGAVLGEPGRGSADAAGFPTFGDHVTIGAHAATISPTFDGHATLDLGAVLPRLRVATDTPGGIGVNVDVQETDAANLTDLINRDALIAAQPDGEIGRIQQVVQEMAVDDALAGAGSGLLVVVVVATVWTMIGARRRQELWHLVHRHERRLEHRAIVVLVAMLITIASIYGPGRMRPAEVPG